MHSPNRRAWRKKVHQYKCSLWPPVLQMRTLYFAAVVSIFFLFSSSILSGRRLDVYDTSTHGVALVRIYNAGLKCAPRGSLEMQDAKKSSKIAIWANRTTFWAISSKLRHVSTIGKKIVKQQYVLHMSPQYIGWQWRNFFISYLCQLSFAMLQNVSYSDITFFGR